MAGNKRSKLKRASTPSPPPPVQTDDDDDIFDDLLAQLDARDAHLQNGTAEGLDQVEANDKQEELDEGQRKNSKSRFRAREMRKAAARAAQQTPDNVEASERIEKEIEDEERAIREVCDSRGLEIYKINPDGHCLFAAVADQLALLSIIPAHSANYHTIRRAAASYIAAHPDDFIPFLPSAEGEDGAGATTTGLMDSQGFQKYCANIRDTATWGGEPEILALARAFDIPIHVIQRGKPSVVVHSPRADAEGAATNRIIQISYHRRMYGLGEHYNSLRPKGRQYPPTPDKSSLS